MTMQWIGDLQNKEDDKFLQCRTKKNLLVLMTRSSLEASWDTNFYHVAVTEGTGTRVNE